MTGIYPLAIFTEPLSRQACWSYARAFAVWLWRGRHVQRPMLVGGHYAVTRSLLAGLKQRHIPFVYNPDLSDAVIDTAIVLSSTDRLKQLCALKKKGGCKTLLAGPNIVVRPGDAGGILLSPDIDRVIVPSAWVKNSYVADGPIDAHRVAVWAAGIDETWWQPRHIGHVQAATDVVIYDKGMPDMATEIAHMVAGLGLPHKLIRYGHYNAHTYRAALNQAAACVVLTESESQGLALAEAWSMNVPTFVVQKDNRLIDGVLMKVSTAPYLSTQTGALWQTMDQLKTLLLGIQGAHYSPRPWILENMTDAVCAGKLLDCINGDLS